MKRVLALTLLVAMLLSVLCACGSAAVTDVNEKIASIGDVSLDSKELIEEAESAYAALTADEKDDVDDYDTLLEARENYEKANVFNVSQLAYDNINEAYEITEDFGSDIYEAWRLGIYDDDELLEDGVGHLASELGLSEEEICAGVAYALQVAVMGEDWDSVSDEDKNLSASTANLYFNIFEDSMFSFCIQVVKGAYIVNGKVGEAEECLAEAKQQMKTLSDDYSDYEHYPSLKGYYTTTSSFFNFCQEPDGSFNQLTDTINDYRNEARDYKSDIDYVFED